jgi:hypothetical protein
VNQPDIGEQAISKAAEIGLNAQLDEAENIDVDIRANSLDLIQGKLESVDIQGEGLVMQKELRVEELDIQTNSIAIDPIKAAFGNIELTHPADAKVRILLKESDIQRAFNSEYVKNKLQNIKIITGDQSVTANIKQINFTFPEAGRISLEADIFVVEKNEMQKVLFTAVPKVNVNGNNIELEEITYPENKDYNPELTKALLDSTREILDLRKFELKEMSLKLNRLEVQPSKMILEADAVINKFPESN